MMEAEMEAEHHRAPQNPIETHRAPWNPAESCRASQRHTEPHRASQNSTEPHRALQSPTEPHRASQSPGALQSPIQWSVSQRHCSRKTWPQHLPKGLCLCVIAPPGSWDLKGFKGSTPCEQMTWSPEGTLPHSNLAPV